LPQQGHIIRVGLVIVIQFRWSSPAGTDHGLGLAGKVLQLLLNGCQLLSEKIFLLLLRKRLVDNGGDLAADFGDGREFDE
jgi:hypothetical protein